MLWELVMKSIKPILLFFLLSFTVACSDDDDNKKKEITGDHIWKQQTDALKTSKEVAKQVQKSLDQQKKKLDQSN